MHVLSRLHTAFCGFVAALAWLSGCSGACDSANDGGLSVRVMGGGSPSETVETGFGGGTGARECLADVTVSPNNADWGCWTEGEDCVCAGLTEKTGTFDVTVTLGELTDTQSIELSRRKCGVEKKSLCFFDC